MRLVRPRRASGVPVGASAGARESTGPRTSTNAARTGTRSVFRSSPVSTRTRCPERPGYRWAYVLETAVGAPFEISTGFILNYVRLELSFAQRINGIDQVFRSVSDFARNPPERRTGSTVASDAMYWIGNITVRTLALNVYYEFRNTASGFVPYVGSGIGPAFATIRGLHYAEQYSDTAGNAAVYDPPLSYYNVASGHRFVRHGAGR